MKNPFNRSAAPQNSWSLGDIEQIALTVNAALHDIKKEPDASERMRRLVVLSEEMHKIYDEGAPKSTDKKSLIGGLTVGSLAAGAVTLTAVSAGAIFVPWMTLPAAVLWVGTHVGIGTAAGAGVGGLWGNQKERRRLKKKYGSVEVAQALHNIVTTVDAVLEAEKLSGSAFKDRLTDAFKAESAQKAAEKPVEKAPEATRAPRKPGNYDHVKKGPFGQ